jgi:hypothetical protein
MEHGSHQIIEASRPTRPDVKNAGLAPRCTASSLRPSSQSISSRGGNWWANRRLVATFIPDPQRVVDHNVGVAARVELGDQV